jgi:hypothetical protein
VRPDHVFLAAIDEDFKNSTIEEAIRTADSGIHWVTTGWHNPKEIIFYRSVLNVPLYVFGRMDEMKADYHRFRNLAKRPKVLHIDRNWEETLPDLDPNSAKELHRQDLLRNQVINFATLLTTGPEGSNGGPGFVVRRHGSYRLSDPAAGGGVSGEGHVDGEPKVLGSTLSEAIECLPQVLEAEKVKFLPYQQMLRAVRDGLAPQVLGNVVRLPFQWRRNRDELQTQYGSNPSEEQKLKLKDYTDASARLQEALEALTERLRNLNVEQQTLGGEGGSDHVGLDPAQARENLSQSLKILNGFCDTWRVMENPEEPAPLDRSFSALFQPMPAKELNATLNGLTDMTARR